MNEEVATKSAEVVRMSVDWLLVATLLGGTRAIREMGSRYLPMWQNEDAEAYERRKESSTLFPGFKRTVSTLSAKPFSKALTYEEDVPAELRTLLEANADGEGRNLHNVAHEVLEGTVGYGLQGILVDYPKVDRNAVRTRADEEALKLHPYMVRIKPEQIVGWRAERQGDSTRLVMLRLLESVKVPDGEFATKTVEQVRVLTPGRYRLFRRADAAAKGDWIQFEEGTTSLAYIPFFVTYGERLGFMVAKPPLIELAHLNVEHWQSSSDQRNVLHVARVPILTVIGVEDKKFKIDVGSDSAVKLPAGCSMEYVEHSGAAIEAGAKDLAALEERMRQAGAELLIPRPDRTTATQVATENAVGSSLLQQITLGVQDVLNLALDAMAELMGLGPKGGHIKLYNEYATFDLSTASTADLLKAQAQGVISQQTLFEELQRRGLVSPDITWEDEQSRIETEGVALAELNAKLYPEPTGPTLQ